ncbi:hypothetical protein [Nodosilinea sp. FACHB-13]|uniref:hypothetical protein n=1 Tax=Cyanophyceae TaxID=3028117 RepID=UPI001689E321|nr:hypothetical protein [Nodosilinea sp. FACHB-13]MBD2110052.1 hypothetical protein [Nodosilinea sp. FACHB-13]
MGFDARSESLTTLGRLLQQDLAPVLGNMDWLLPSAAWNDLPVLDAVAADWAVSAIVSNDLAHLYAWLTAGLLGERTESGSRGIDVETLASPQVGMLGEATVSALSNAAQGTLGNQKLVSAPADPMANQSVGAVGDAHPMGVEADAPSLGSRKGKPPIVQPDQLKERAMASTPAAVTAPIVGGFAELTARLADPDGLLAVHHAGAVRAAGVENVDVADAHPTGIDSLQGVTRLEQATMVDMAIINGADRGQWKDPRVPTETSDRSGTENLASYDTDAFMHQNTVHRDMDGAGMPLFTQSLLSSESTPWDQNASRQHHNSQPFSAAAPSSTTAQHSDLSLKSEVVEPLNWAGSLEVKSQALSSQIVKPQDKSSDGLVPFLPEQSLTWTNERSPSARPPDEVDLEEVMDAIARTINRDYRRFYGP